MSDGKSWLDYVENVGRLQYKKRVKKALEEDLEQNTPGGLKKRFERTKICLAEDCGREEVQETRLAQSSNELDQKFFAESAPQNYTPELKLGELSSLNTGTRRKIGKGRYPIDMAIDLHSYTREEAYWVLSDAIRLASTRGMRMLLVITGKGTIDQPSVIRMSLQRWLNSESIRKYIVYFDRAAKHHGGAGAFYVLLKKEATQL